VLRNGVLTIGGTRAADNITLRLKAGHPGVFQIDVGSDGSAEFNIKRRKIAKIVVNARAGSDRIRINERNGVFTDRIPTTVAGPDGNDTIVGGSGSETLRGGDGSDSIDGNSGNDRVAMGDGDDTFVWDPGDGSDTVEGRSGADTMRFNGGAIDEQITLSANGERLGVSRDVGNVTMDTAGVERVDVNTLAGADLVTANSLSGTDVTALNVDLAGALGGATGDGLADRVVVNGTNGDDAIDVSGDADEVKVSGLAQTVAIFHPEITNDRLEMNTRAGSDAVNSPGLAANAIQLFVDGVLVP
jgi:Ca2+-binding RTX toxin-like protein